MQWIKKLGFFILLSFLQSYFIFLVFNSSLPKTAIELPFPVKKIFNSTIKEGWAFFTRNPREPMVDVYIMIDGKMTPYIKPNGDISNFWGISRDSRELGFEVSELYQFIDKSQWRQFHSLDSAEANANLVQIKRTSLIKYLPKNFVVVQSERVPWAWANYESRVTKNYTSVKVNLN